MSGKPEMLKKINLNLIYNALIDLKTATRSELSSRTKISLTTIRTLIDELLDRQQIVEMQLDKSSGGRRALRYALNAKKNFVLCFFVRENLLTYQVINLTKDIIDFGKLQVSSENWSDFALNFVGDCCKKWDIITIAIGAEGVVRNGDIYNGCNLDNLSVNSIINQIKDTYNVPVIVENDLNSVAFGYASRQLEKKQQSFCGNENIAYINFEKSSVCAGFVIDGKIVKGYNQFSGELAFMPLEKEKMLNSILERSLDKLEVIDIISRVVSIVNCVINPNEIIVGGKLLKIHDISVQDISLRLKDKYLPESICPPLSCSEDFERDYMAGITKLALYGLLPLLPIYS